MKERYHISGMTCSACSSHVEKSVNKVAGVEHASVNLLTETMDVTYDEQVIGRPDIIGAVEKAGYGASPMEQEKAGGGGQAAGAFKTRESSVGGREGLKEQAKEQDRAMKWRLGISVGFLIPLMYVAMFHMYQDWFGLPVPGFVMNAFHGNANAMNFALTQFLLLLPILYMNRKFFAVGFKTLFHLSPNMDSLIALGASAATGYGIFAMYRISYGLGHGDMALVEQYSHDLYFESAGMILTLITVGKYLESRSKGKTSEAITKLMDLSPKMAVILTQDGQEKEVPTQQLKQGDIFLVKPGSLVPVDGIVIEGRSSIDEAAITGESVPVEKKEGDSVVSATMNKSGFLKCRAQRVGDDTTLAQIIRLVEEASASKAPIAQLADKVAGIFVPVVIAISLVTLGAWLAAGAGAEFAISTAIAVLVISCPCALGLATPVAIMVGTGVGASQGILIKSGEALQRAKEIDTVVLDKTGTITEGSLSVMQVKTLAAKHTGEQIIALAAALESKSEHPLAEAVVRAAKAAPAAKATPAAQDGSLYQGIGVSDFNAVFGRGIEGKLEADWIQPGKYYVGNSAYLAENHISLEGEDGALCQPIADAMADEGQTPLFVADEERVLGIIGVADSIKESSLEAIQAWHQMKVRVIMLTGDNRRTAEAVRKKLNLKEVVAEVLPQDKEKKVSQLKEQGCRVAMIGDGINDAPALAAADVGMAIGAGTDVAIESADIILMKSDLRDAVTAMRLSRAVIRNIKENLFWAFFYNSIGIPLAAGLLYPAFELRLNPMFGAAAMSLSSIFVVGNALRLRGFKSSFGKREANIKNIEKRNEKGRKEMTKVLTVEGMMCAHCTARVQKALEAVEGVKEAAVSLEDKTAAVQLEKEVSDQVLTAAVTDAGYEVTDVKIS
ncbi:MAG TPA: heavy metal translocating P-type ATPase [Candidatus Acetatifactor stercoripullorum]|uniref:Copper-exporting P-type ATPase n=1 Tax=Candidatus Acetatifactor stercoripullorum TaxID=2838414 RepID=A0A9D1R2H0_9FIRM|nr:heavy metal translocating P-type ATPase [uncultured Acetatifactor sp.]HIW80466.1 heavy metal translocating P-type ATPase [Candidatus Acetatifactor stercoripullorum]